MTQTPEIVTIVSNDDKQFKANKEAIKISGTINHLLEQGNDDDTPIPLPSVEGKILEKIISYCNYHYENKGTDNHEFIDDQDIDPWDLEFIESLEKERKDLFDVALAADYLNIPKLWQICWTQLARNIRSFNAEEIIDYFYLQKEETEEKTEETK